MRYLKMNRNNRFAGFVGLFSTLGVTLGVAALITVLSIMNGFENQIREQMLGQIPHATLKAPTGQSLSDWPARTEYLKSIPSTLDVSPIIATEAVIQFNEGIYPAFLDGIEPAEYPVTAREQRHVLERLQAGAFSIVLDRSYQHQGIWIGDAVRVLIPGQSWLTPLGRLPIQRPFTVVGFLDDRLAEKEQGGFIHIHDARRLLRLPDDAVTDIRMWVQNPLTQITPLRARIAPQDDQWQDWRSANSELFRAVHTEKIMTSTMLALIVAVALFNILSAMVMQVLGKEGDIAILRTLGMPPRQVLSIFMLQGSAHGVLGSLLGTALGLSLSVYINPMLNALNINFYFSAAGQALPVVIQWYQILWVLSGAILASMVATIYPAWYAAHLQPAEALRYE